MIVNKFRGQINARMVLLDAIIQMMERNLKGAPTGTLLITKKGKYPQYFLAGTGRSKSYISKENFDLIKQLAQQNYDSEVLKAAKEEKALLEKLLKNYPSVTAEEYYETMPELKRQLVKPIRPTDEEYIAKWEEAEFEQKESTDSEYRFVTNKGERVRSKSEKMIADRLFMRGMPYRYEAKLEFKNGTVIHPDFTLLDMKKRREVYLEHFGMMDDSGYSANAIRRIRTYEHNGILLGDKLLVSMETSRVPIDMGAVDKIIDSLLGTN